MLWVFCLHAMSACAQCACGVHKRATDPLELELAVVWVLWTEPKSFCKGTEIQIFKFSTALYWLGHLPASLTRFFLKSKNNVCKIHNKLSLSCLLAGGAWLEKTDHKEHILGGRNLTRPLPLTATPLFAGHQKGKNHLEGACLASGPEPTQTRTVDWNLWTCKQNKCFL